MAVRQLARQREHSTIAVGINRNEKIWLVAEESMVIDFGVKQRGHFGKM